MHSHPLLQRLRYSISFGGKCAFIFAPALFVFLFATILMVGGDGRAPGVTHLSANIIGLPVKLLGLPFEGAIAPAVLFWSLLVFGVAFLYALVTSTGQAAPDMGKPWYWPIVVVVFVIGAVVVLIQGHRSETSSVNEKALALEFVRTNSEVLQMVGGEAKIDLVSYTKSQGKPIVYDIGVRGNRTLYAIVEASGATMAPTFKLLCVTPLYMGQRDPFKHPCEQK